MPIAAAIALSAWFGWYVWHWEHRELLLEVYFFDVAKGSAIFIRTPQGKTALVGGGQGSDIIRKLTDVMPFYRHRIDTVIYPADPANGIGLTDVASRYDIGETISLASSTERIGTADSSSGLRIVLDEMKGNQVVLESISAGTSSASSMLKLSYGKASFLLADILSRKDQEMFTERFGRKNSADVLQFRSASQARISAFFFDSASPKYLVVSKMPLRPKPKPEIVKALPKPKPPPIPKPPKPPKLTKSGKPAKAKPPALPKPPKPVPLKKPAPPKDPPFDLFAYSAQKLRVLGLDREKTVEFVSDGVTLRVIGAKQKPAD